MSEQAPHARPAGEREPGHQTEHEREETSDLGYRDTEEERAYEKAQPSSQPEVSSEPEPDAEPADAG
jgi:hypothetical protein